MKNQGPTIYVFLAASNGASAKNMEDPAECDYINGATAGGFGSAVQYLE